MKKILAVVLAVMLSASLVIFASAAETFTDDFSADLSNWDVAGGVQIIDGAMVLGAGADWVQGGYEVAPKFSAEKYTAEFEICGNKNDCYYGFGFRAPLDAFGDFNNGGRNDIPQPTEIGHGISVDIFSKGTDCTDKIVVAFNDGAMSESPNFKIAYPAGYSADTPTKFKIVDNGSSFELYLADTLLCKVELSGLSEGYYKKADAKAADGTAIGSYDINILEVGRINFFQRNNQLKVDNFSIVAQESAPATSDVAVVVIALVAAVALTGVIACKKARA